MIVDMHDSYNMTRYLYDMSMTIILEAQIVFMVISRWRIRDQVNIHCVLRRFSSRLLAALL